MGIQGNLEAKHDLLCPYCGHHNAVFHSHDSTHCDDRLVCLCDGEEGGCDRYFVAAVRLETNSGTYKIEGEE